ncbi:MAG: ACT domain-containing protein [Desulfarculaceae bacterium]|jgi:hypothetical protein
MTVKQITVQMPNKPGQLAKVSDLMGKAKVNILALFVSTTTPGGDGLMRFVANDPDKAARVLKEKGWKISVEDVIAAETPHHAGGLQAFLNPLKKANVNVEYVYPWIQSGDVTILILGTDQNPEAIAALQKDWIRLHGEELYKM